MPGILNTEEGSRIGRESLKRFMSVSCRVHQVQEAIDAARTLAIAGPKPFHNAATPSCAIVLRAQSKIPLYVPVGADCIRDFSTYNSGVSIDSAQ